MSVQSISFGSYLKKYRNRNSLTQDTLAERLYVAPITISRWERDLQTPDATAISNISQVLDLSYIEEHTLLAMAGYVLQTKMPRLKQIKEGLKPYIHDMQNDIFPSIIVDYHFTHWVLSPPAVAIAGYEGTKESLLQSPSHFFPVFDSKRSGEYSHQIAATQTIQIKLFLSMNILRQHESWFRVYPTYIKNVLSYDDYLTFEHIWKSVLHDLDDGIINVFSDALEAVHAKQRKGADQLVKWKQRIEVIADLPQFAIMRFHPEDMESAQKLFENKKILGDLPQIRLWDIYDDVALNNLIATYVK